MNIDELRKFIAELKEELDKVSPSLVWKFDFEQELFDFKIHARVESSSGEVGTGASHYFDLRHDGKLLYNGIYLMVSEAICSLYMIDVMDTLRDVAERGGLDDKSILTPT